MNIVRHPQLADDIREISARYAEVSDRVLEGFWRELDSVLASILRNPRSHHFDGCGLRRANLHQYPYHLLYDVGDDEVFLLVLRHDRRHPDLGIGRNR